jgi:hypothetical protein
MGRLLTRSARPIYINEDFSQGFSSWLSSTNTTWSLAMGLGDSVLKGDGLAGATATRKFTGHDWDSGAGLYFAPYRYYIPSSARWTSSPSHLILAIA